jgi:hypothetical protein
VDASRSPADYTASECLEVLFGSLGLFVALIAGAGMVDMQTGHLVLVALCVYGAYLLFFDGGVTQEVRTRGNRSDSAC